MIRKEEAVSFYTHLAGAVMAFAGAMVLWTRADGGPGVLAVSVIYGISITFLFSSSACYHAMKLDENDRSYWRKLDHFAIFVMIAGTYTPIAYFYLEGPWLVSLLSVQWGLVLVGGVVKFIFIGTSRFWSTMIYVAMGWMALIPLGQLVDTMPRPQLVLVFAGGISYTLGAVLYALKKPVVVPGRFGFHEIFHILVLAGAACHYAVVFRAV